MIEKLSGELSITQPQGTGPDCVCIMLKDKDAHVVVVEFEVSLEDFTRALGNRVVDCVFDFNDGGLVGKKRELKYVTIERNWGWSSNDEQIKECADKQLKVDIKDGWSYRLDSLKNGHNYIGEKQIKIPMWRHVDKQDVK